MSRPRLVITHETATRWILVCSRMVSKADKNQLVSQLADPWWRLNNLYWIEDEGGNPVRFQPRPLQKHFLANLHYWNIILKARQLGFTTLIDIWIFDRVLFEAHTKAGIIAHTRDAAEEIFRTKVKFVYEHLPSSIKKRIRADQSRAQQMVFSNGSSIRVGTSMRSGTMQYLHVSEYGKVCAQYPEKAKEIRLGSFPAVHDESFCFIESTAEGVGGDFYSRCQSAQKKIGRVLDNSETKFHFYPWYLDPKYSTTAPDNWQPDKEERRYWREMEAATNYVFSINQKYWYHCKADDLGDDVKQEYPTIPQEAFLFSGRPVFRPAFIQAALLECYSETALYDLSTISIKESDQGMLQVWDRPKPGRLYAVGSDVAEGLVHGDNSTIDVCDQDGYQVAHWCGHVEPDALGDMLIQLGNWYNNALAGVERNNHGLTTLTRMKEKGYRNIFIQEDIERRAGEKVTKKMGWLTTTRTKPLMIDHLNALLRDQETGIVNRDTLLEMQTYVLDDDGSMNAQTDCFDDRVISYAIAQQMVRKLPRRTVIHDTKAYQPVDSKTGY